MTVSGKKAGKLLVTSILVGVLASALAFGGADVPGKGKGKGRGRGRVGAPEAALALLVGTGLSSLGLLYAKRKRNKK